MEGVNDKGRILHSGAIELSLCPTSPWLSAHMLVKLCWYLGPLQIDSQALDHIGMALHACMIAVVDFHHCRKET